ncbi:DUF4129 domain-containing protein [Mucilaginibacter hurinus]|uniref:DUF4129 domain-containing protein n=1 Tax=Mucilaginibacter hurinus TaxID=2201324 RepID=A0A367GLJ6_9SPHI|nr:DUF4129 domain-containing protein [Mucilaginibacter hurinus]RCH53726.1 DUF4129 domain-containing protein [Mucilaginibacter hurinus]
MTRYLRRYFLLWLLLALELNTSATGNKPAVLHKDSAAVTVKAFDTKTLKKYAEDEDFAYVKEKKEQPSAWNRFWMWLWALIIYAISNTFLGSVIFKYLLPGLALAGLIYVIMKAAGMDVAALFSRKAKKSDIPYYESLENIHEIDFDSEINNAIAQYNYRLAVRLLYLKCLKQLSDRELIKWQIDKTNSAYYYELSNPAQREMFGALTRRFEYVWYGDFGINEHIFNDINRMFGEFKQQLP